jgi:magnesium transporter
MGKKGVTQEATTKQPAIEAYGVDDGRLVACNFDEAAIGSLVWIDVVRPGAEEEASILTRLGVDVPTRQDMDEIEFSSRVYDEEGKVFLTAMLPAQADTAHPELLPVTFILDGDRLITVRHHAPRAFATFRDRAMRTNAGCVDGRAVCVGLLESVVDRIADIMEMAGQRIDGISREVFKPRQGKPSRGREFQQVLESIGSSGDLLSRMRESLSTLERLGGYLGTTGLSKGKSDQNRRLKTLNSDIASLSDHATFLSQKVNFLLDATLGMINIEQSGIIKIFSVVAVIFLPPTLVASIYGMNFQFMPELDWQLGYPYALGLMVASAILPYTYFKYRGWL